MCTKPFRIYYAAIPLVKGNGHEYLILRFIKIRRDND